MESVTSHDDDLSSLPPVTDVKKKINMLWQSGLSVLVDASRAWNIPYEKILFALYLHL